VEPLQIIIILVVLAVAVAAYFLFARKAPQAPEIKAPPGEKQLPKETAAPAKKAEKPAAKAEKPKKEAEKPKKEAEKKPAEAPAKPAAKPAAEAPVEAKAAPEAAKPTAAAVEEAAPKEPVVEPARPVRMVKQPAAPAEHKRDVEGLRKGLTKARDKEGFFGRLKALFTGSKELDPNIVEQIEEVLLTSDVGVKTTEALLADIKDALQKHELKDSERAWEVLRERATKILDIGGGGLILSAQPTVVMIVGVNGVGKTTTIGKLATKLKAEGRKVVLAAGDTFRAAAVQQLNVWGKRVDCEVVSGKDGANPGAVIFDAIQKAKEIGADIVLADTAGRLHTKTNLMDELTKVARTMNKAFDGAPHETLLVLDATNGQNALQQAAMFKDSIPLTGIVLTKLDGTAKGGVILGICAEHNIPVRYIGIGERAEDLRDFVADEFVEALLGQGDTTDADAAA